MELALPFVVDALSECGLVVGDTAARDGLTFSRAEIYAGQAVEEGVLYITESPVPKGCESGAFLAAAHAEIPEGALACTTKATAVEAMNALNRYVARFSAFVARLEESCLGDGDLQALCQALSDFADNPVVIYDDTMTPVAQTAFPQEYALSLLGAETIDAAYVFRAVPDWEVVGSHDISNYPHAFRTVNTHRPGLGTAMCGIMFEGLACGFAEIFGAGKPITDGEMLALERAAKAATHLLPFRNTSFIESSLAGRPLQGPRANIWLSALRWNADDELYVAAIDLSEAYSENPYARKLVERTLRTLLPNSDYTVMEETSIIVANARFVKRPQAIEKLLALLPSAGGPAYIGVSDLVKGVAKLHIGYEHARFAATYARRTNQLSTTLATFELCRFSYLASLCDVEQNADFICDDKVRRLFADDCATGTDNTLTIKIYIETGFNLNATAERLVVHRNTVAYRLKQVAERYGIDLSSPVTDPGLVFQVLLSCKILLGDS